MVPGLRIGFHLLQQAALDVEVLDDGLDDPIDVGELFQIVIEIADRHQARERWLEKRGGL